MPLPAFPAACRAALLALCCACLPLHAAPEPPVMRLGDTVRPLHHHLELRIVPAEPGFEGRMEVEIEIRQPTDFFWMNARDLDVRSAELVAGGRRHVAKLSTAKNDFLGLQFDAPLPAGRAKLHLAWRGEFSDRETRGLFRQQENGLWYVYSQFESINARRAVPSFDEPQWKTPWQIDLVVPKDQVAVSNAPATGEEPVGTDMKRVRFAPTVPLPSYLVALGVGPFDIVEGGTAGWVGTPLRYIVPRGRGGEAAYAREVTPKLLALLEEYFGRPYPFGKLDSLVIPVTVSFGAMENPGLITYRAPLLLQPPGVSDERAQVRYAAVASHEIAHQWFGDLVTMAWWTDIWLNESFATWMTRKNVDRFKPEWQSDLYALHERQSAIEVDRLRSTRQVRQAVRSRDDLENAFDRITYEKGGAVLTMFERWLGEAKFRAGVRGYIDRFAFGNASTDDFLLALGEMDPSIVKSFESFIGQPGVPAVETRLDCTAAAPALVLRQARFLPAGPGPDAAAVAAQRWTMPYCARVEGRAEPVCAMVDAPVARVPVPGSACPAWVLPNPGGSGYFVSVPPRTDAPALPPPATFSVQEAVAFLSEQSLLVDSGALAPSRLLAIVSPFARDERTEVVKAAADTVRQLQPALLAPPVRERLPGWVREHFGARAAALGWLPRAGDDEATRRLRLSVVNLVAQHGRDPALRAQARELVLPWLAGDRAPLGAMFRGALGVAGRDGDAALFETLLRAAAASRDGGVRTEIYKTLGRFRDPALQRRAYEHALADGVDVREAMETWDVAASEPETVDAVFAFLREHEAVVEKRLSDETLSRMPRWFGGLCTAAQRAAFSAHFGPRAARHAGGERNYAQALEQIDICIAARGVE